MVNAQEEFIVNMLMHMYSNMHLGYENNLWHHLSNGLRLAHWTSTQTHRVNIRGASSGTSPAALSESIYSYTHKENDAAWPSSKNSNFCSHACTHRHTNSSGWTEDVNGLSPVKERDNVSNWEPLRSVRGSREAAGRPLCANSDDKRPRCISHSTTVTED